MARSVGQRVAEERDMIDLVKAGIPVVVRMLLAGGCEMGAGGSGNQVG